MALDFTALKSKLNSFTKQGTDSLWKPPEGKSTIRIVPWVGNPSNPFTELYFHYFGKKTHISPLTFGRRDPVNEFADKIMEEARRESREAEKAAYHQTKDFRPKLRTYAPVIVRGEESKGVRFFGFGKTVYQDILSYINDPDYGDITHPTTGRDIVIEYTPVEKGNGDFAKTSVKVKPNQTPIASDTELAKKILSDQPDIFSLFKEPTFDELRLFLERYLNPDESVPVAKGDSETNSVSKSMSDTSVAANDSAVSKNALDEFDKLFDSK